MRLFLIKTIFLVLAVVGATMSAIGFANENNLLFILGIAILLIGVAINFIFNRCPYCKKYLDKSSGVYCPYCGEKML